MGTDPRFPMSVSDPRSLLLHLRGVRNPAA